MSLKIKIVDNVLQKFPDLMVLVGEVKGVRVSEADPRLEEFKEEVFAEVRSRLSAMPGTPQETKTLLIRASAAVA